MMPHRLEYYMPFWLRIVLLGCNRTVSQGKSVYSFRVVHVSCLYSSAPCGRPASLQALPGRGAQTERVVGREVSGPSQLGVSDRARPTQVDLNTRAHMQVFTHTCLLTLPTERSWDNDTYYIWRQRGSEVKWQQLWTQRDGDEERL